MCAGQSQRESSKPDRGSSQKRKIWSTLAFNVYRSCTKCNWILSPFCEVIVVGFAPQRHPLFGGMMNGTAPVSVQWPHIGVNQQGHRVCTARGLHCCRLCTGQLSSRCRRGVQMQTIDVVIQMLRPNTGYRSSVLNNPQSKHN